MIDFQKRKIEHFKMKHKDALRDYYGYYEFCIVPMYEEKYDFFTVDAVQMKDVFVNILEWNKKKILVSILFPSSMSVNDVIDWLEIYYIHYIDKNKKEPFITNSQEIILELRFFGDILILSKKGKKKMKINPQDYPELTETYDKYHEIVNTDDFHTIED